MSRTSSKGDTPAPLVLVVEDEVLIRFDAAEALRDEGLAVIEASNGAEALDLLRSGLPIAMLVTDITMPGEPDGLRLAALARELHPGLPVLLASAVAPAESGFLRTLRKPYVASQLLSMVAAMLEEGWHTAKYLAAERRDDRAS